MFGRRRRGCGCGCGTGCGALLLIVIAALVGSLLFNLVVLSPPNLQKFFPKPPGYRYTNTLPQSLTLVGNVMEAINLDEQAGQVLGTPGRFLLCYQQSGAADIWFYMKNDASETGLVGVLNGDLAGATFLSCMQQAAARSAQPCLRFGSTIDGGSQIIYVFLANGNGLCSAFNAHFSQFPS